MADRVKNLIEKVIDKPVIWWPLEPPQKPLLPNTSRVTGKCLSCGNGIQFDVPTSLAYTNSGEVKLRGEFRLSHHSASSQSFSTPSGTSSSTSSQQFNLYDGSPSNSQQQKKHSTGSGSYEKSGANNGRNLSGSADVTVDMPGPSSAVEKGQTCQVLPNYRQYGDCFVSARKIEVTRLLQEKDYDFKVQLADNDIHIRWVEESVAHYLRHHGQIDDSAVENLLAGIPKRVNGMMGSKAKLTGYGMHARQGWSLIKFIVALAISQCFGLAFFVYWLFRNPGDLQNAAVPSFFILALMGMAVIVPDIWIQ
ncbi:hypothetical protein MMC22_003358 [Lobaria immixta]|nr:hypothetical protein [Lobaria immixta]